MVFLGANRLYALCILVGMTFKNNLAVDQCYRLDMCQCPIPKGAKNGSRDSVVLSLYRCIQESPSKKSVCLPSPSNQKLLKRGEVVDLQYDLNGYAVTAEYFGLEVCVAYQAITTIWNISYNFARKCKSACFISDQIQTYETKLICSSSGCGGGWKRLKFVAKFQNSASLFPLMSFFVLIISAMVSIDFAS